MAIENKTKEKQYQMLIDLAETTGIASFGLMANESWKNDPRRTLFTLSRYKFVSKMLEGRKNILEVGCADAFGTRVVQQTVEKVTVSDFDPFFIEHVNSNQSDKWPLEAIVHNMISDGAVKPEHFDAVFALDVLEHINKNDEQVFISNCCASLDKNGVLIFGMPSLESQVHASPQSKIGHVNCKSGTDFRLTMEQYFHNVFMFSMNDEVVHTGYQPMAHYLFALCTSKKH